MTPGEGGPVELKNWAINLAASDSPYAGVARCILELSDRLDEMRLERDSLKAEVARLRAEVAGAKAEAFEEAANYLQALESASYERPPSPMASKSEGLRFGADRLRDQAKALREGSHAKG